MSYEHEEAWYEDGIRKTRIFMPEQAAKQEAAKSEGRQFVHYTSASVALNILRSKEVWMRNVRVMNDHSEIVHGINHINWLLADGSCFIAPLAEAVDQIYSGAWSEAVNFFKQWSDHLNTNTYIFCLSEHPATENQFGRLSMWRAYGGSAAKAALVINFPFGRIFAAINREINFSPALYFEPPEIIQYFSRISNSVRADTSYLKTLPKQEIVRLVAVMLMITAVTLKHPAFKEELEWRVIHIPAFFGNTQSAMRPPVIEIINDVPQPVYKVPLKDIPPNMNEGLDLYSILQRIILGPAIDANIIWQAFILELQQSGLLNPISMVTLSNIPLRT